MSFGSHDDHDGSRARFGTLTTRISGTFARLSRRARLETESASPPSGDPKLWYVRRPGVGQIGPVSLAQIEQAITEQRIPADCEVRRDGWPYWRPLWAIEEALRNQDLRRRFAA